MPKEIKDGDMKTFLLYLRGDDKIKSIAKSINSALHRQIN